MAAADSASMARVQVNRPVHGYLMGNPYHPGQTIRAAYDGMTNVLACYWIMSQAMESETAWTLTPPVLPREARHPGLR
jgi:hypothetical protein